MKPFLHIRYLFFSLTIVLGLKTHGQIHVSGSLCTAQATADNCLSPTLFFDMNPDPTINGWQWDFGNGRLSSDRNPQTGYPTAGKYTVILKRFKNGAEASTDTKEITITSFNQPLLRGKQKSKYDDKCSGPIKLDPYTGLLPPKNARYKWFPDGQTTQTIEVENTGCYSVEVTNDEGCSKTAQIEIEFCLANPNASSSVPAWYFGNKAGIKFAPDFKNDTTNDCNDPSKYCYLQGVPEQEIESIDFNPIEEDDGNEMITESASAMVYDINGSLVLYSNGKEIFDKDDAMVPGGSSLSGSDDLPQSTIIVPKVTCNECPSHYYYVITLNKNTRLLTYNLVDIRGQKLVVEQSILLATNMAGRITSTKSADGYQIFTHEINNNNFKVFTIDKDGIKETSQTLGTPFTASSNDGTMKISDLGTKMAVALTQNGRNYVDIYNLSTTGILSSPVRIDISAAPPMIYGIEFSEQDPPPASSPSGTPPTPPKYLYATIGSSIYQINIAAKTSTILGTDPNGATLGAMKLAPPQEGYAKYIIFARENLGRVGRIDYPDDSQNPPKITFEYSQVRGLSGLGLPEITQPKPQQAGGGVELKYKGKCAGSITNFTIKPMCAGEGKPIYLWDFGDGSKILSVQLPFINHTYQKPGDYKLKLTIRILNCGERTYEGMVKINPAPEFGIPGLIPICDLPAGKFSVLLDPKVTGGNTFDYTWVRGLGTQLGKMPTIQVSIIDKYTLKIINNFKCTNSKEFETVRICEPQLFVPDVFTPNKTDDTNDRFRFFPYFVSNMKIRIYNRWGEMVFSKDQPSTEKIIGYDQSNIDKLRDLFWDGKYKNEDAPPGVYAYEIEYVEEFTIRKLTKTQRGSVLLIRE